MLRALYVTAVRADAADGVPAKAGALVAAISRYRASFSTAPNFGYELCLRKVSGEDCRSLDLSSWSLAMNAAEPVAHSTIRRFEERFCACGFSSRAFFPGYGLAEATICVSGGPRDRGAVVLAVDPDALEQHRVEVVPDSADRLQSAGGVGLVHLDEVIKIVDPETLCPLAADRSARSGWRLEHRERLTRRSPTRRRPSSMPTWPAPTDGPYLRTGDLGFVHEGQLFVTGRIKDLILIRGRNFYPQDIELTVETSHSDLRQGCRAAFAYDANDEEHLVVVQEVRENAATDLRVISAAIRLAVKRAHGVEPRAIVLVASRSVIKTSSGKIARRGVSRRLCARGAVDIVRVARKPLVWAA